MGLGEFARSIEGLSDMQCLAGGTGGSDSACRENRQCGGIRCSIGCNTGFSGAGFSLYSDDSIYLEEDSGNAVMLLFWVY